MSKPEITIDNADFDTDTEDSDYDPSEQSEHSTSVSSISTVGSDSADPSPQKGGGNGLGTQKKQRQLTSVTTKKKRPPRAAAVVAGEKIKRELEAKQALKDSMRPQPASTVKPPTVPAKVETEPKSKSTNPAPIHKEKTQLFPNLSDLDSAIDSVQKELPKTAKKDLKKSAAVKTKKRSTDDGEDIGSVDTLMSSECDSENTSDLDFIEDESSYCSDSVSYNSDELTEAEKKELKKEKNIVHDFQLIVANLKKSRLNSKSEK